LEDPAIRALALTEEESDGYWSLICGWKEQLPRPKKTLSGYPSWIAGNQTFQQSFDKERPYGTHRIGGHPDYIQHDPKLEAQLVSNGLYCGNSTGYEKGRELGLDAGAGDWELLFQVDSEEATEMIWGDVGRLYFLIRKQDLAARAFEKTWMVWDCH